MPLFALLFLFGFPAYSEIIAYPVIGVSWISSEFGPRKSIRLPRSGGFTSSFHDGTDIACKTGSKIPAISDGVIVWTDAKDKLYGRVVVQKILFRGIPIYVRYAHLSRIWVNPGDYVNMSSIIGLSGNTGNSTGPHEHIALMIDFGDMINITLTEDYRLWNKRR